jgi:hypothetical protein
VTELKGLSWQSDASKRALRKIREGVTQANLDAFCTNLGAHSPDVATRASGYVWAMPVVGAVTAPGERRRRGGLAGGRVGGRCGCCLRRLLLLLRRLRWRRSGLGVL